MRDRLTNEVDNSKAGFPRLAEWYNTPPYRRFISEERRTLSGVTSLRTAHPPDDYSIPPMEDISVVLNVGSRVLPVRFDAGPGFRHTVLPPDGFCIMPPRQRFRCTTDVPDQLLMTAMPVSMVSQMLGSTPEELPDLVEPLLHSHHIDEVVSSTTKRLWQEMGEGDLPGRLFAEGASLTIVAALLRISKSPVDVRSFALTNAEVQRLVNVIDDRLHTNISLGALADEIGWRPNRLGRAFKAKLGQSPYQYVLDRRIARARDLLEAGELSISEVAYACGFSSQQHMTSVFTKRLGVSPAKYRRLKRH